MTLINDTMKNWLKEVRRDFHMHPETKYEEHRTTERIIALLGEMGVEARGFEDMTGAVGLIRGGSPGPTLALRADIDALNVQEMGETPYKSTIDGKMHACGHDANTTIMLGVARLLSLEDRAGELKGNVKLLFQPAEEGGAGAMRMIEKGVLEDPDVDRVLAGHLGPEIPAGQIGIYKNQGHASADQFELVITGKGGHGGRPHQCVDPIVAGAGFVNAIQSIVGRNLDPLESGVVTVGQFLAGTAENIIPETALLKGTIRALTPESRDLLIKRLHEISAGLAATYQVRSELTVFDGYPPNINDEEVSSFMFRIAAGLLGPENVYHIKPTTGAEDFAFFAQERPAALIRIGCGNEARGITAPLHSPYFDMDEDCLGIGVEVFTAAVMEYLS